MNHLVKKATLLGIISVFCLALRAAPEQESRLAPIGIRVETEGPDILWTGSAFEPTAAELKTLQSLAVAGISKQKGVQIVPLNYPRDYIFIGVVVGKISDGHNGHLYVASSVYTTATAGNKDEFVSHNVLAGRDLPSLADALVLQFASMKLRATLGLWT
jgi:hypothetical protein